MAICGVLNCPVASVAEPEDVAGTVRWRVIDLVRHVTGSYLPVCGGGAML